MIKQEADDLLAYWVDTIFAAAVDRLVGRGVTLNQNQFDALVSFAYNIGNNEAFASSTLLKKVKINPKDPTIRDEFMRWIHINGVVSPCLVNRRRREADYYFLL